MGTAAIQLPPKDAVPAGVLFQYRIFCEGFGRLARCGYAAAMITIDYKWNLRDDSSQDEWSAVHRRSGQRLVKLAERNGGLFVNVGQGFAAQNHLLAAEYCDEMKKLEDCVEHRPFAEVKRVLEEDLQRPLSDVFERFDEIPIAAASLAQVHKAVLKAIPPPPISGGSNRAEGTGRESAVVAVKVQYIDVQDRFHGDMFTMQSMLKIIGHCFPGFNFGPLMHRAEDILIAELDFRKEAENQRRAGKEFHLHFGNRVAVPPLIERISTPRVLVTEFVNGVKVTDTAAIERLGLSVAEVAALVVDAYAYQMFVTGFLHADPHPGNMLVQALPGGSKWPWSRTRPAQLVVLDHGLYTHISDDNRLRLAAIWTAIVTRNTPELKKLCAELGIPNYYVFASTFLQFPYDFFHPQKKTATTNEVHLTRQLAMNHMEETTAVLESLPKEYVLVLRNLTTVRSVSKMLGNPVSRTGRMLSYSSAVSLEHAAAHGGGNGLLHKVAGVLWLWRLRLEHYWSEWSQGAALAYASWRHPELVAVLDSMTQLG